MTHTHFSTNHNHFTSITPLFFFFLYIKFMNPPPSLTLLQTGKPKMSSNPDLPKPPTKPILPWKTRLSISLLTAFTDATCRSDGTVNRRLLSIIDCRSPPSSSSSVVSSDITVDPNRNLWFRLYSPSTSHSSGSSYCCGTHSHNVTTTVKKEDDHRRLPVVIFFHGGGFCFLTADARSYDIFCRRFAKELHAIVISVNYRLTPEHRFPSQYDDGFDVLKFLDENHSTVLPPNADITKIFLAGDSAGGNLAHHVAVRAGRNPIRVAKIIGLISMQPYFGGEERTEAEKRLVGLPLVSVTRTDWVWKALLGEESDRDHYAVNVSGPNAEDISGLDYPDTIVFVGGFDPLQDWQRRYYEWLRKSGKVATLIEYPNMIHAFHIFPELLESSPFIRDVKDFIDKVEKLRCY